MGQSTNDSRLGSDVITEQVDSTLKYDPAGNLVIIHTNTHREQMRLALQNANRDVSPPEFLKDWLDNRNNH